MEHAEPEILPTVDRGSGGMVLFMFYQTWGTTAEVLTLTDPPTGSQKTKPSEILNVYSFETRRFIKLFTTAQPDRGASQHNRKYLNKEPTN